VLKPRQRFGFHNPRHSLATFLLDKEQDTKTIQGLLRLANVSTILGHLWPERECVDGGSVEIDAEGDFAKRLERGKLTFTGDVLQL